MKRALLVLALSFSLTHCSLFLTGKSFPEASKNQVSSAEVEYVLDSVYERFNQIENFRALSEVELQSEDEMHALRYVFAIDRTQQRMRIDVLVPSSAITLQLIVVKDGEMKALFLQEKIAYEGNFTPSALEKIFGFPADIDTLLSLLTGTLPSSPLKGYQGYDLSGGDSIALYSTDSQSYVRYDKENKTLAQRMMSESDGEDVVLIADYISKDSHEENMVFPSSVRLELPKEDVSVQLWYKSIKVNTTLNPLLFDLEIPSDFSKRTLP